MEKSKATDEKQYEIDVDDDILVKLQKCRSRVRAIKNELEMYWDARDKVCYSRDVNRLFKYSF